MFLILCLCFILSPFAQAQYAQTYRACLNAEKNKIEEVIKNACSSDAAMLNDPGSYGRCLEQLRAAMPLSEADKRCKAEAEKLHYGSSPNKSGVRTGELCPPGDDSCAAKLEMTLPTADTQQPKAADKDEAKDPTKPDTAKTNPSGGAGFDDASAAESEAQQDIATCDSSQARANQCCTNPLSCSGSMNSGDQSSLANMFNNNNNSGGGGISDYCRQMGSLSSNYGNVNSGLAAVCAGAHNSCTSVCGQLVSKYNNRIANCGSCAALSVFESALNTLTSRQSSCQNLQSRSSQLATSGLATANNRAVADYCSNQASTNPNSIGSGNGGSGGRGGGGLPSSQNVEMPNGLPAQSSPSPSGFREAAERMNNKDFNVPDASGGFSGYDGNLAPSTQAPSAATKGAVVPNNSGGQIPGGDSQSSARLGPNGRGQPRAGGSQQTTEIEQGFRSGGGYTQPAGNGQQNDGRWGANAPGRHLAGNGNQFDSKMDLKQFLPGGSRAAMRRFNNGGNGINAKEENLFLIISNKMVEKCRLGVLWQCQ